jgi:hypothetical protein
MSPITIQPDNLALMESPEGFSVRLRAGAGGSRGLSLFSSQTCSFTASTNLHRSPVFRMETQAGQSAQSYWPGRVAIPHLSFELQSRIFVLTWMGCGTPSAFQKESVSLMMARPFSLEQS